MLDRNLIGDNGRHDQFVRLRNHQQVDQCVAKPENSRVLGIDQKEVRQSFMVTRSAGLGVGV